MTLVPPRILSFDPGGFFRDWALRHPEIFLIEDMTNQIPLVREASYYSAVLIDATWPSSAIGKLRTLFASPLMQHFSDGTIKIILDQSSEGWPFFPDTWIELHRLLSEHGVGPEQVIYLTQNGAFQKAYEGFVRGVGCRPIRIHLHHAYAWLFCEEQRRQPIASPTRGVDAPIRLLSLNGKCTPHRLAIVGFMLKQPWWDQCLVSLLNAWALPETTAALDEQFELASARFPSFASDVRHLHTQRHILPLVIDKKPEDINYSMNFTTTPHTLFQRTAMSLCAESEMLDGDVKRYTEKALKTIAGGHPFVIAGAPGVLGLLSDLGFSTYSPLIAEDYDLMMNQNDRLQAIMREIDRIMRMDPSAFSSFIHAATEIAHLNRDFSSESLYLRLMQQAVKLSWTIQGVGIR